jgi:hypothetical protein
VQTDLFGSPVPKKFHTASARELELFGGDEWMYAAEQWALVEDLSIDRWEVNQHFRAGGAWRSIRWNKETRKWEVTEV